MSKTATAPIETVRLRMMVGGAKVTIPGVIAETFSHGGIGAFFRGNLINCLRTMPTKSVQFIACA